MTDDRTSRPLSGEIMAAPGAERRAGERRVGERRASPDVVDAEFVTVLHGGDRSAAPNPGGGTEPPASPGMDILKGKAERGSRRGGPLFWTFGLCLVVATFWVSGGHALVSRPQAGAPQQTARPAASGTLRLAGVTSRIEQQSGRFFLLVDGEVVNESDRSATLSGLDISVAGKDGRVTRYFLGTNGERLEPGGRFAFSSRLEAPKDGVETVTVDFRKEG